MKLILVRHCDTDWPEDFVDDDHAPLTEDGRRQAEAVAEELARRLPSTSATVRLLSSPAQRALETAVKVAERLGVALESDEQLILSSLADPDVRHAIAQGSVGEKVLTEMEARTEAFWHTASTLAQEKPDAVLIAVSHDLCIAGIICRVLTMPASNFRRFRIDLGSLSVVDFRAQRTILASLNETYHLESPIAR
jgi:broad specificity phosphatase PhoE